MFFFRVRPSRGVMNIAYFFVVMFVCSLKYFSGERYASSLEFKCCRNLSLWCDFMSVLHTAFSGP